ncbi:hypothetical protein BH11MYX3_BH11MYX3_14000 [soil metagenome]
MRIPLVILSLVLVTTACGKNAGGGSAVNSDLTAKLDALTTEACACKDKACADAVTAKVTTLGEQNKDFDKDDLPALQATQAKMDMCIAKLNPVIVAYLAIADDACKCTDKACADKVGARFAEWTAAFKAAGTTLHGN